MSTLCHLYQLIYKFSHHSFYLLRIDCLNSLQIKPPMRGHKFSERMFCRKVAVQIPIKVDKLLFCKVPTFIKLEPIEHFVFKLSLIL